MHRTRKRPSRPLDHPASAISPPTKTIPAVSSEPLANIDADGAPPAMLGTSMLLALPGALRTGVGWRAWLADYWAARDVGADWRDPLPMVASRFLWMAWVVWRARRLGVTPQQAATVDVEYNGLGSG